MSKPEPKRGRGRPATGTAPIRYFRMEDEPWELVERAAKAGDETTSAFVRETLLKAAKRRLKAE
jgi:uncharacterized protein (DUF1778 family)